MKARNWQGMLPLFVLTGVLSAAPPGLEPVSPSQPADTQLQSAAREYAASLFNVIAHIEQQYIRPVSTADLVEAALAGLYEAARQPMPESLAAEIKRMGDSERMALIRRVREELGSHDALRGSRALVASLKSLPKALDPHSGLTGPKEFQSLEDGVPQIGLEFPLAPPAPSLTNIVIDGPRLGQEAIRAQTDSLPAGPVRVSAVQPGSPAQKAGIRPGDLVISVDGRSPEDPAFVVAFQRLLPIRGVFRPESIHRAGPIKLKLLRAGQNQPIDVSLTPTSFRTETIFGARRRADGTWDYLLDPVDRIGYIRIGHIQLTSHKDFAEALRSIRSPALNGLILDLRWCPGGYLGESSTIARLLLAPDQMPIARQRDRSGQVTPVEVEPIEIEATDFPVVVLVNNETSGGGELIAAVLQDYGRATIAGQKTVGKSSVQRSLDRIGIPFKITTSVLIRPRNKNPQAAELPADEWPVRPDPGREIPATSELSRQLKTWYTLSALRPADSTEALPLDDPENDPQRQAAVQMLRRMGNKGLH